MTGKSEFRAIFCAAAALFCLAVHAERHPIDRYQSIIDRQMFGQPPPNFDPTMPPSLVQKGAGDEQVLTREQEAIKSAIHFSAINVTPAGDIAVGFTDNSDSKLPVHYYLKVGESRNGWKVLEADPIKATMKVAKGDIEVSLGLGANSAKGGGSTARAGATAAASAAPAAATAAGRRAGLLASRRSAGLAGPMMGGASLRERRAARELARQEEAAKEKKLEDERKAEAAEKEEKEKEREAQRQAEREEQRRELQLLKDELRAQREAVERAREEREAPRRNENAEDEN